MIDTFWLNSPGFDLAVGLLVYALSYTLSVYATFLYHAGAKFMVAFEGRFERKGLLDEKTGKPKWLSWRFATILALLAAAIGTVYQVMVHQNNLPEVFVFLMGGLVLMELAEVGLNARRIVLFRHARPGQGLVGELSISYRLSGLLVVTDLYLFTGFCLLVFLLTGSWFFLGGMVTTFLSSRRLRDWVLVARGRVH